MRRTVCTACFVLAALFAHAQINTDHMMMVGRNALYFKDYVLSIQYFNQVINAKPYLYEPYFFRGLAKFYLDDYLGSEQDCSQAVERNPFVSDCYELRALNRMRLGLFDEAIADYREALKLEPEAKGLWHNLALCYGHTDRLDEAVGVLDTLRRIAPSYTPALVMRAQVRVQQKDTVAAMRDISESLSIDKYDPDVYSMRAILYLEQGRYAEAEEDLTYSIRLHPSSNCYVNRALARANQSNLRGAMSDYDLAIELNPNSFLGHYNRGLLRAQVGDDNRAIEDFDFVIEQEPENYIAHFNRGLLRAQVGDYEGAELDFTDVLNQFPKFLFGYQCRAEVREKLGRLRLAEEDRLVLLRAQLGDFGGNGNVAERDEEEEDSVMVRRKSDNNVKKYKRLVVADDELALEGSGFASEYRGKVQNRNVHVEILPMFALTYYEQVSEVSKPVRFHNDIDNLNKGGEVPMPLILTTTEKALDSTQIDFHFADINTQTTAIVQSVPDDELPASLAENQKSAVHWFIRGLDFYLVQDFNSAIADFSSAIATDGSLWVAYLNRAVARGKQAIIDAEEADNFVDDDVGLFTHDMRKNESQPAIRTAPGLSSWQQCLADLEKVIDLAPDLSYAYYNRANVYMRLNDYQAAIADYSEALRLNPSLAEAYYNRGLALVYTGQNGQGIADLSKAGELGLYGAYNLIKRFAE